jgi:hypothetical protein
MTVKPKKLSDMARTQLTMVALRNDYLTHFRSCRWRRHGRWSEPCSP